MDYDEDSLIMKYSSEGLENLLNVIPADTDKIKEILRAKKITVANAAIMYNSHEGISLQKATNTVSVSFLGSFIFELNPTGTTVSTAGLKYMTWIGHTDKNETEFMEYFNQEQYLKELEAYESGQSKKRPNPEHRCQFCKDLGIKFYYPEFLRELKGRFGEDYNEVFNKVRKAPLLLLDDIGAETVTNWNRDEILGSLLQYRMQEGLPTFFTSNNTIKELEEHLSLIHI